MNYKRVNQQGDEEFFDGEYWLDEIDCCRHCREECEQNNKPYRSADQQYSLGLYAGRYCDECWDKSGYRKEGPEGFDPTYAGERYDNDY